MREPPHILMKIITKFVLNKNKYCLIPAGCIYFLQPLDVAINKPLKDCIKEEIKNFNNLSNYKKNPDNKDIINIAYKVFFDDEKKIQ